MKTFKSSEHLRWPESRTLIGIQAMHSLIAISVLVVMRETLSVSVRTIMLILCSLVAENVLHAISDLFPKVHIFEEGILVTGQASRSRWDEYSLVLWLLFPSLFVFYMSLSGEIFAVIGGSAICAHMLFYFKNLRKTMKTFVFIDRKAIEEHPIKLTKGLFESPILWLGGVRFASSGWFSLESFYSQCDAVGLQVTGSLELEIID